MPLTRPVAMSTLSRVALPSHATNAAPAAGSSARPPMPLPRDHAACYQLDGYRYTAGLGEQQCDQNKDLHGTGLGG